jgi:hypothetical protein
MGNFVLPYNTYTVEKGKKAQENQKKVENNGHRYFAMPLCAVVYLIMPISRGTQNPTEKSEKSGK